MRCREARRLMYLYRQGEIPEEAWRQVQQHAGSCRRCAEELREIESAGESLADLRGTEPGLHAPRELTDQIMHAVQSERTRETRPHLQAVVLPFRRLQFSCTLAAALIAAAFFAQNTIDVYRIAILESRLSHFPSATTNSPGDLPLAAVGLNTIAEFGRMLSGPPAPDGIDLRERLQLREAVRSFQDVLREGPPGFSVEVERLRIKYPELWFISPLNGLTSHDRLVLAHQGKALMRELHTLLQPGKSDYEK